MSNLWYLSPSNQDENVGIGNYGTEYDRMRMLTNAVLPHLDRCGIRYRVARKEQNLASRKAEADSLDAYYYLALHSNAGGGGSAYGPIAFYFSAGKELAEELITQLRLTGQKSNRASSVQGGSALYEVKMPLAKCCLLEVDFHDSREGVEFLIGRQEDAAEAIAKAIVKIDGAVWIPAEERTGEQAQAEKLGLFDADETGDYRWSEPATRAETAKALIRLMRETEKR